MNSQGTNGLFDRNFGKEIHADSFIHRDVVMRVGDGVQFDAGPRARLPGSGVRPLYPIAGPHLCSADAVR